MNKIVSGGIIIGIAVLLVVLIGQSRKSNETIQEIVFPDINTQEVLDTSEGAGQAVSSEQAGQVTLQTFNINNMNIEVKKEGEGVAIENGKTAVVNYTGKLTDGTVFDSSIPRGQPFEFPLGAGMVIEGWEKGVLGMKVGEVRTLTIPPEMGYGERGAGATIPPNATLIFDVELLAIK